MTQTNPHASAIILRDRADRDLRPVMLQEIFRRVAAEPQVFEALPLDDMRDLHTYPLLAASWIASLLAATALALSVSGLYGVLTYALGQRRKEIGIRMALGASAGTVIGLVIRQCSRLASIGAIIGIAVACAAFKVLDATIRLQAISLLDIGAFAVGLVVVMAAAALAAYQPARRAARIDPSETLRAEG